MDVKLLRDQFNMKISKLVEEKMINNFFLTKAQYKNIMGDIMTLQISKPTKRSDYYRLRRFDIAEVDGGKKVLIKRGTNLVFVHTEQIFDLVHGAHLKIGHGGRDATCAELKSKYANVTKECVNIYLQLCQACSKKRPPRKCCRPAANETMPDGFKRRVQVNLIDMQSRPDGEYNFILTYQDQLTKFTQLRPVKRRSAEEICHLVESLFCTFGAPKVLYTDCGRGFENDELQRRLWRWPGCKHVFAQHAQAQGSIKRLNRDILDRLNVWLAEHPECKGRWQEPLQYVQYQKNVCLHGGTGRMPFEALFCSKPVVPFMSKKQVKRERSRQTTEDAEESL